ncbi:MAG: hypothetical protein C0598_05470 [Marinilabiliales bacterium]|nr:MAG: hypothetical protein C0598_05470 [Marinilabiliales bacterium]
MGKHPINLFLRFILELIAFTAAGIWGYGQTEGFAALILAVLCPISMAAIWGIFAVPNDPSRSGKTVIKTPGIIRLILELLIFGFAIWAFYSIGMTIISYVLTFFVILHYALSYDRIGWLMKN